MITIKAVSYNGQPPAAPLVGEFGEAGGVIGRSDGNALVLPDPERFVSRAHATVAYRAGSYMIRDLSSASPVYVNGKPLGNGNEARLLDGDELRIGAYTLRVIGERAAGTSAPVDDPMNLFGDTTALRPAGRQGGIPDDFNPFATAPVPRVPAQGKSDFPVDFGLGLQSSGGGDINQLFGLGGGAGANPFPAGHPLAGDGVAAGPGGSVDPLVVLGAKPAPAIPASSQRNDTPEIRGAFIPPRASPSALPEDDKSMLVSWGGEDEQERGDGIKTMVVQSPLRKAKAEPPPPPAPPPPPPPPMHVETVLVASVAPTASPPPDAAPPPAVTAPRATAAPIVAPASTCAPAPAPARAAKDNGELLSAFLAGAGVPDLEMKGPLDVLTMQMLGHLLREATQGTLDLLVSRTLMKREIRAEMTMIVPQENNPLKFSPNVEAALTHLLAPRGPGFMPPVPAMRDAYDDLRAHQLAFMAGMRAALAGVLRRFNPEQLERRLSEKSVVDSVLPMNRKAKLWSSYSELYADITREAEDDFHSLFGKAFLTAYQAQLDQLQQDGNANSH